MKTILDWARRWQHWLPKVQPIAWVSTMMKKKTWRWGLIWHLTLRRIDTCFRNEYGHILLTFTSLPTPCFTKFSLETIGSWLRLNRKEAGWYSWCPHVWIVNAEKEPQSDVGKWMAIFFLASQFIVNMIQLCHHRDVRTVEDGLWPEWEFRVSRC